MNGPDLTTDNASAAPGELELLRTFVNTLDIEAGTDTLSTPDGAGDWLAEHGHPVERRPSPAELGRLVTMREAIRDLATTRGSTAHADALEAFDRIAARYPLVVDLSEGEGLRPVGSGVDGFIGRILAIVAASALEGTWDRLKSCANDRCRWLYYDHSRNRTRTWCSMDVCGSRSKMRAYRARRRQLAPHASA